MLATSDRLRWFRPTLRKGSRFLRVIWRRALLVVVTALLLALVIRHVRDIRLEAKRVTAYAVALSAYERDFPLGLTRREVDAHLTARKVAFMQECCYGPTRSWANLVKIGEESPRWFCSEQRAYVVFEFTEEEPRAGFTMPSEADELTDVRLERRGEGCL
jgi:hypothetical protein